MMEFLQPALLWGTWAVAIPIAIHFWHQKKGKVIAWAATQWLLEKSQQSQRGIRLDQLLLLTLRCLILITLAILLSEPLFRNSTASATQQKVHLVQPLALVVDNYRFELEEAQKKGETIYWLTPALPVADELTPPATEEQEVYASLLQTSMNQLVRDEVALHLYIKNTRGMAQIPTIQTPVDFQLHAVTDTLSRPIRPYREVANQQKLYIQTNNRLRVGSTDPQVAFATKPLGSGPLLIHLDLKNQDERKTVKTALLAFSEVYSVELTLDEQPTAGRTYDLRVTDQTPEVPHPTTLYIATGQTGISAHANVAYTSERLTPQTSAMVANGQLPEWLGQHILDHIGLRGATAPFTPAELATLFKPMKRTAGESSATTQRIFFILLLVLVCIERGIALTRNA